MRAMKLGAVFLFHPLYAVDIVKRDSRRYAGLPALVLLISALLMRTLSLMLCCYTVSGTEWRDVDLPLELFLLVAALGTWVLVNYFMTEILSGSSTLYEIVSYTAYALLPYILTAPLFIAVSWVMSESLMPFYRLAQTAVFVWAGLLLFLGLMRANDYGFWRAVLVLLILVIAMLLVWALLLLFMTLVSQAVMLVKEVLYEIDLRGITS